MNNDRRIIYYHRPQQVEVTLSWGTILKGIVLVASWFVAYFIVFYMPSPI